MSSYFVIIQYAVVLFPIIAALITFPYFIINYHKYGSVSKFRVLIVYTFILYLMCAYFLIILPLPDKSYVAGLTTSRVQLIPFHFVLDFIKDSGFVLNDIHTYLPAIKTASFYQPIFNILLTVPFGMYLRYYFKDDLKKTIILSFCLSLFFELTQLSGLYFIYPRGYRLFDVDDLLFNTLGGLLGYFVVKPFLKLLPSREKIDKESYEMGKEISALRRINAFIIDIIIYLIILLGLALIFELYKLSYQEFYNYIVSGFIFVIIPFLSNGQTIGKMLTKIKVVSNKKEKTGRFVVLSRSLLMYLPLFVIPFVIKGSVGFLFSLVYFIYLIVIFIQVIKKKELWYEKVTNTKNVSIVKKDSIF